MYSLRGPFGRLSVTSNLLITNSSLVELNGRGIGKVFKGFLGNRELSSLSPPPPRSNYFSRRGCSLQTTTSTTASLKRPENCINLEARDSIFQLRYYSQSSSNQAVEVETKTSKSKGVQESRTEQTSEEQDPEEIENSSSIYDGDEEVGLFLTDEEMQELSQGDPELIKKIKFIQLEHAVLREEGQQVPSKIYKWHDWKELLNLDSKSKRRKYFIYLFKTEMTVISQAQKKKARMEAREKLFAENPLLSREEDTYGMVYNLNRNTLFLRLYDQTINRHYNSRVSSAILHHPPLILDCSYDEFMSAKEAKNCAKQLEYCIGENRLHPEPYNIILCNARRDSKMMQYLQRMIPLMGQDNFPLGVHEGCFTDLYPRKRIVYLSPHTRDDLEEYDEDDIYVIGAMVDRTNPRPYSLAKAKKLNVAIKRLPLDKHLMWGLGQKSLTLNQMIKIMLDVRYSKGNWHEAFKHIPMRKLCRDYHPYPNQIDVRRQDEDESSPLAAPYRKMKKSRVLEDHELLLQNRRKGYRRSEGFVPRKFDGNREQVRSPNMRSLFQNEDHYN